MPAALPLPVLLAPFVIAAIAVALMLVLSGPRSPRRVNAELGYKPDPRACVSMDVARYVGGHPDLATPFPKPWLLMTERHLGLFARRWGAKLFLIPWEKVEHVALLDRQQMEQAAIAVRGLTPGAIEQGAPDNAFLRVRFEDERNWWQNVVFELPAPMASNQLAEIERHWQAHRHGAAPAEAS